MSRCLMTLVLAFAKMREDKDDIKNALRTPYVQITSNKDSARTAEESKILRSLPMDYVLKRLIIGVNDL